MKTTIIHLLLSMACGFLFINTSAKAQNPGAPVKILNVSGMPLSIESAVAIKKEGTWRLRFTLSNLTDRKFRKPEFYVQLVHPSPQNDGGVGWESDITVETERNIEVEWKLGYKVLKDVQLVLLVKSAQDEQGRWEISDEGFWDMFRPYAGGQPFKLPVVELKGLSP